MSKESEHVHNVLVALLGESNEGRKQAEKEINRLMDNSPNQAFKSMMDVLLHSDNRYVRQYCVVLCRKNLTNGEPLNFIQLEDDVQGYIKRTLLEACHKETVPFMRRQIADCIAEIAKCILVHGMWNDFFDILGGWCEEGKPELREIACFIFGHIADDSPDSIDPYWRSVLGLYEVCLKDEDVSVRVTAMEATRDHLLGADEDHPHIDDFHHLTPLMLNSWDAALRSADEALALRANTVFCDIACIRTSALAVVFDDICNGCANISLSPDMPASIRKGAVEFFTNAADQNAAMCRQSGSFLTNAIGSCVTLMLSVEDNDDWLEEDYEPESKMEPDDLEHIGSSSLDHIAECIGKRMFMPSIMGVLESLASDDDWKKSYVFVFILGQISEYFDFEDCPIAPVVEHVMHPHPRVQFKALNALGQLCSDHGPDLQSTCHQQIAPLLLEMLKSPVKKVRGHAAAATFNYLAGAMADSEATDTYAEDFLQALMGILEGDSRGVQQQAMATISIIAQASINVFGQYYDNIMPVLKNIVQQARGDEFVSFRARAMESLTFIGIYVGADRFEKDAVDVMEILLHIMRNEIISDDNLGSQYILHCWTRLAACVGSRMVPYLPEIMPFVMNLVLTDLKFRETMQVVDSKLISEEERMDNVQEFNNNIEDKRQGLNVFVHFCGELEADMVQYALVAFAPIVSVIDFYVSEDLREEAAQAIPAVLRVVASAAKENNVGMNDFSKMFESSIEILHTAVKREPSLKIVMVELRALIDCINVGGEMSEQGCLSKQQLASFSEVLKKLTADSHERYTARMKKIKNGEVDEEDAAKLESMLKDENDLNFIVADFLGAVLKTHGENGLLLIEPMHEHLCFMTNFDLPKETQCTAWFVFDDLIENTGPACLPYLQPIMDRFLTVAAGADQHVTPQAQQAAAWGIGMLAQHLEDQCAPLLPTLIECLVAGLRNIDRNDVEKFTADDNVVSALVRVLEYQHDMLEASSFQELLGMLLHALPIVEDEDEGVYVNNFLCELVLQEHPLAKGEVLNQIINILGHSCYTGFVDGETQGKICMIFQSKPDIVSAVLGSADDATRANVEKAMHASPDDN